MNITEITALYNAMVQLQELFENESDAIDCICGLRLGSSEFRTAFFKVRDTLMQCPVSKAKTLNKPSENSVNDKSTEHSTISQTNKTSENNNSEKLKVKKEKTPNSPTAKKSKEIKSDHIDFTEFDEFITNSYDFDEKSEVDFYELLKAYRVCRHKGKFIPPLYGVYRRYISKIFKMEGDSIKGLKPKYDTRSGIENTESGYLFRHPYYTDIWCSEAGIFYYRAPSGELIVKTLSISRGSYIITIGSKNTSARRVAMEYFLQRKLPSNAYVFHRNGNKNDFAINNLSMKGMEDYISQEKSYSKSDVNECCEYIVAHNKDISKIEQDTNFRIGWQFAKNILEKTTHRDISDKYF